MRIAAIRGQKVLTPIKTSILAGISLCIIFSSGISASAEEKAPKLDDPSAIMVILNSIEGEPALSGPISIGDAKSPGGPSGIRINGRVCGHHKTGAEEIWSPCLWRKGVCVCK